MCWKARYNVVSLSLIKERWHIVHALHSYSIEIMDFASFHWVKVTFSQPTLS